VVRFAEAMVKNPAAGFPSAVRSVAEREANYRLLNNEHIEMKALLAPHARQTVERAKALGGRPVVAVDSTAFVFSGEAERDGLDRLGADRQGFDAFVALAVSPERQPLGVLSIRPIEGKGRAGAAEWADAIAAAAQHIESLAPIYVMDREADAYHLFASQIAANRDFVIRVSRDRLV
jgi:hypothetical protein